MDSRTMSLVYSSGIDAITSFNSSFDKGVLRVCYVGANRNGSFISKDTFERCMPSIYNCPIVCRYDRATDSLGSHDVEVVKDENGTLHMVNATHPVGVVPESARYWWEEIDDGTETHDYLCVDVLLWKRQEAYRKIREDGIVSESMEITIKDGCHSDGLYIINNFEFTAFCLLGSAEPCYESASLEVFSCSDLKAQLAEMMHELKESFSITQSPDGVDVNQNYSEGGKEVLEQKTALMEEFGLTAEELDFDIESFSVEELREKFEAMSADSDPVATEEPEVEEPAASEEQFALVEQFLVELREALYSVTVETCWGEMNRYSYVDCDMELMQVYAYDMEDWNLYGFPYSTNGDNVTVDFDGRMRKKFAIVDFDEGEQVAAFASIYKTITERHGEFEHQWTEKYQAAEGQITEMQAELDELRTFKSNIETAEREAALQAERDEVFANFTQLDGVEEFEALRENCAETDMEVLTEKCYAILGRRSAELKFNLGTTGDTKPPRLKLPKEEELEDEPYGGIFKKYGVSAHP